MIVLGVDQNRDRLGPLGEIAGLEINQRAHGPAGGLIDTWSDLRVVRLVRDGVMAGIEILDDTNTTIFEGWVTETATEFDKSLDVGTVQLTVVDLLDVLTGVDSRPEPGTLTPPFATNAYHELTGTVTEVVAALVDAHCGQAAPVARRRLTVDTPTPAGPTINLAVRFKKTLAEKVESLAVEHGLVVNVYHDPATGLRFSVKVAEAKPRVIVGPDVGNVDRYSYGWSRPEATHVIAGGQGELTARTFATAELLNPRWPMRREQFIEHTEIDNAADLEDAAEEHLVSVAGGNWFSVDVAAASTSRQQFGRDFDLGDTITLRVAETDAPLQVTAVKTIVDQDGTRREMTVGLPPADGDKLAISAARTADVRARSLGGQ